MQYKRILIFDVNWIGDVLFSTAVIRNIRRNFPGSFLACIIPSRCYLILKDNPNLDEIIIFDEKDRHRGIIAKFKFIDSLRRKKFDAVYLLHRSASRALICRLAGIKEIFGYYTKKRGFLLTKKIQPPALEGLHRKDYYLTLIEKAGLRVEDSYAEFFISEKDTDFVDGFLSGQGIGKDKILAVINPGGNWLPKRWPAEYWARLSDMLISGLNAKVVISGGPQDAALTHQIQGAMKEKPVSATGVFNLKQLGALLKKADLFITADTGPLHIANAVGSKKIIAIFGPTSTEITGPYPLKNITILKKNTGCKVPCYVIACKDNRCMKAVTPEEVFEQVKLLKIIKSHA